jgi:DNA polymerase III epsilon subunit-like protein
MKADTILFIDTETGGIQPGKNSLLSLALAVWKESKIKASTEILINDGVLDVTEKALEINGINLEEHKKKAVSPAVALQQFDDFIKANFPTDEKIVLGGHNITFDVNFLNAFLAANNYNYHQRFSHRFIDTASILFYLYLAGKLKTKINSSQQAFDYFGIMVDGRHTALGDVLATAQLFSILVGILYRDPKRKASSQKDMPDLFASQSGTL